MIKIVSKLLVVFVCACGVLASEGGASSGAGDDGERGCFRTGIAGYPDDAAVLWVDYPLSDSSVLALRSVAPSDTEYSDTKYLVKLLGDGDAVSLVGNERPWDEERVNALVEDKYLPRLKDGKPTAPFIVWHGSERVGYGVLGVLDGVPGVGVPSIVLDPSVYGRGYALHVGGELLKIAQEVQEIALGKRVIPGDSKDATERAEAFKFEGGVLERLDMTVHPWGLDDKFTEAQGFVPAAPETPSDWEIDRIDIDVSGEMTPPQIAEVDVALRALLDIGPVEGKRWSRIRNEKYLPFADTCGRFPVQIGTRTVTVAFVYPWDDSDVGISGMRFVVSHPVGGSDGVAAAGTGEAE